MLDVWPLALLHVGHFTLDTSLLKFLFRISVLTLVLILSVWPYNFASTFLRIL